MVVDVFFRIGRTRTSVSTMEGLNEYLVFEGLNVCIPWDGGVIRYRWSMDGRPMFRVLVCA
jgi:hypothetical protein